MTVKDIELAVREGFESIEHVKRYTTTGMATDQGKTSNMNALGLVAEVLGRPVPEVGTTTFRPPYTPVTFAALAGPSEADCLIPRGRRRPSWAVAAAPPDVGFRAARCFPLQGEDMDATAPRMQCRAHADRHLRRLDARQIESRGPMRPSS